MINLDLNDPPVRPAVEGRFELPQRGMFFTVGAEFVAETAYNLLRKNKTLACDIETRGLGNLRFWIKTVTFADDVDAVILDPRDPYQRDIIKKMIKYLKHIIIHRSMYDVPCLIQTELMDYSDIPKVIDTIITSRLANPGEMARHDLERLAKEHYGIQIESKIGKNEFFHLDLHSLVWLHGAALDSLYTFRLYPDLQKQVDKRYDIEPPIRGLSLSPEEKTYIKGREQKVNHVLLKGMSRGLCVDIGEVDRYEADVRPQENRFELIMKQYGMTTYTNRNQLIEVLLKDDAIPPDYPRTGTKKLPSTKKEDLEYLQHPLAQAFRGHAQIQKIKQYLNTIADESYRTGRVFATTNLLAAGTGRISMSDPPLQQFSPAARSIIVADEGDEFCSIDWGQVEPTLMIFLSSCDIAIEQYEKHNIDVYSIVSNITGIERKPAKTVLLAQMYSQGVKSLALRLGVSYSTALEYRNRIFASLPGIETFIKNINQAGKSGKVHSIMGRVLDLTSWNGEFHSHKSVNYLIQSSAYDLLGEALIRVDQAGLSDYVQFSIHDEVIVSQCAADDIAAIMRKAPDRITRLLDHEIPFRAEPTYLGRAWKKL